MNKEMCPIFRQGKFVSRYVYSESKKEQKQVLREELNHLIECNHPYCQNLLSGWAQADSKRADRMSRKVIL